MALQRAGKGASAAMAATGALLCLLLAACNPADRQPQPRLEAGRGFYLNQDGDTISLAYGQADSDEVGLMLQCQRGSRRVEVSETAAKVNGPAILVLISGPARSQLKAEIGPDDETGAFLATGRAPADLPAFDAFRKSGRIAVKVAGREEILTANASEQSSIARFFAACERAR